MPPTVLGKVMTILHAYRVDDDELAFTELRARTGLPKATLHRLLGDLTGHRLLDRTPSGYRLGGGLYQLGIRASVERRLVEVATPYLEDLYERSHETVHLGIREGHQVLYLAKIGGHRQAATPSRIGGRLPLHATAIGKALLTHAPPDVRAAVLAGPLERRAPRTIVAPGTLRRQLDRIADTGVAFEFEESQVGLACVASPILDGQVSAAVSITGPSTRFDPQALAAAVSAAAAGIALVLARRGKTAHG